MHRGIWVAKKLHLTYFHDSRVYPVQNIHAGKSKMYGSCACSSVSKDGLYGTSYKISSIQRTFRQLLFRTSFNHKSSEVLTKKKETVGWFSMVFHILVEFSKKAHGWRGRVSCSARLPSSLEVPCWLQSRCRYAPRRSLGHKYSKQP